MLFLICLWFHKLENGENAIINACHSKKHILEGTETPAYLQEPYLDDETTDFIFLYKKCFTEFSVNGPSKPWL